jgi:hypothetical protein
MSGWRREAIPAKEEGEEMKTSMFKVIIFLILALNSYIPVNAAAIIIEHSIYDPAIIVNGMYPIGQTFKAEDQHISAIGFWLIDFNPQSGPISANIELFRGVGIYGQSLGTASVEGLAPGFDGFYDADFSFVNLTPGEMYTAIVSSPNARHGMSYRQWRNEYGRILAPDPYIYGNFIIAGNIDYNCDAIFRVIPEPATILLFALGGLTLRRKR